MLEKFIYDKIYLIQTATDTITNPGTPREELSWKERFNEIFNENISIFNLNLPFSIMDLITRFVLPLFMTIIAYKIIKTIIDNFITSLKLNIKHADSLKKWNKRILRLCVVIAVMFLLSRLLGSKVDEYIQTFFSILNDPIITSGGTKISITTLLLCIPIFYFASWTGKQTRRLFNKSILDKMGIDESRKFSMISLTRYSVMTLVLLFGLNIVGINLSSIAVIFGVLGIGIGFGLQNVVANFFSGMVIIFSSPIKEGDRVLVDGYEGVVVQISMLSTIINTVTEETIIVPNTSLVEKSVYNYSYKSRKVLIKNEVQISYNSDLDKVMDVLNTIGNKNPFRASKKETKVRVKSLDESGITMLLIIEIDNVEHKYEASSWTNYNIITEFRKNNINIPYPHMNVLFEDINPIITKTKIETEV